LPLPPHIRFLGNVPDSDVPALYRNARALLFTGEEDFGLTPLESQATGRPVIAYAKGAPGHILALCTNAVTAGGAEQLDDRARTALMAANDELAKTGQRVLAVASGQVSAASEATLGVAGGGASERRRGRRFGIIASDTVLSRARLSAERHGAHRRSPASTG